MTTYIYDSDQWPSFSWDEKAIHALFGEVRHLQGKLIGQMTMLGFSARSESALNTLTQDVIRSAEIEGEKLDLKQVRSSIASKLGIPVAGLTTPSRQVIGMVDLMLDATRRFQEPLTEDRLFGWHAALFPTGYSGLVPITVGQYRTEDIQIVSGAMGKEQIHYEAIPVERIHQEMSRFLDWFNHSEMDPVLKSAIAHFWFIIIHPFDDGNGRIARALSDLLLARADGISDRYYSLSNQILLERKQYYAVLQQVQHSSGDITHWLQWYLSCLRHALIASATTLKQLLRKIDFWAFHEGTVLNERQRLVLNKLLDGFEGKLKTSTWARLAKCSTDTALRDIKDLLEKGILRQNPSGGRSTTYDLADFPDQG